MMNLTKKNQVKKTLQKDKGEENFEWIHTQPWNGVKILYEPKVWKKVKFDFTTYIQMRYKLLESIYEVIPTIFSI